MEGVFDLELLVVWEGSIKEDFVDLEKIEYLGVVYWGDLGVIFLFELIKGGGVGW